MKKKTVGEKRFQGNTKKKKKKSREKFENRFTDGDYIISVRREGQGLGKFTAS